MTVMLGVDTGGTYTDAVLIRDETDVLASAKALTTRHDLALGITEAVRAVLDRSGVAPGDVALASLSTTLATNALVEGQGGRAALVYVGFAAADLARHGLKEALGGDPVLVLGGGHSHSGTEAAPLDLGPLDSWLTGLGHVSGFAVAAQFATRNPAHELAVAARIREMTGAPVSLSHHLSARLGGPRRALTALLNARLIGLTHRLIGRAGDGLAALGITAPLMVVRGDGALMSAPQAMERPIETILSGPAASIVGARWLTGKTDAMISDIGGTTTDIALLRDGRPAIDPEGARVGPHRTMVEAVAMRTSGLGGDSEVHPVADGLDGGVTLGPRRLVPVALIGRQAPGPVHRALDAQLLKPVPGELDGRFVRAVPGVTADGLGPREAALLDRIGGEVQPLGAVLRTRLEGGALMRLVARGLVEMAGVTPSDAAHLTGQAAFWDAAAAEKALTLMARRRGGSGERLAMDAAALAAMIVDQLVRQTGLALLEAALAGDAPGWDGDPAVLVRHALMQRALAGHRGLVALDAGLNVDVVGLGASAASYYPAVGTALRCPMVLPEHGDVANAIGAVVGRITIRRQGSVTTPSEGRYRAHLVTGPEDFPDAGAAMDRMEAALTAAARAEARTAGAEGIRITASRDLRQSEAEARQIFVEALLTVEATGRPRIARG